MESLQETIHSFPLKRTPSDKSTTMFASIENRNDILERRLTEPLPSSNLKLDMNKTQNIRSPGMNESNSTKRVSISPNINDSFYAIRSKLQQVRALTKENSNGLSKLESQDLAIDLTEDRSKNDSISIRLLNNDNSSTKHSRKRILPPDQGSTDIIIKTTEQAAIAVAPADASPILSQSDAVVVKRKKSRHRKHHNGNNIDNYSYSYNSTSPKSLYQTCKGTWPESSASHGLGDLSYDNVQALSSLLKVRLCQAKFKMLSKMSQDDELFMFLSEECTAAPKLKRLSPNVVKFVSDKQSHCPLVVVGNGKNLFSRQINKDQQHYHALSVTIDTKGDNSASTTSHDSLQQQASPLTPNSDNTSQTITLLDRQSALKHNKERKKRTSRTPAKAKKTPKASTTIITSITTTSTITPKRKPAAFDITPITLSDGTSVYVCEPCNKRYKNRNGLTYHLQRCKSKTEGDEREEQEQEEEEQGEISQKQQEEPFVNCVCNNTIESTNLLHCTTCSTWTHFECVELSLQDSSFTCPQCKSKTTITVNPFSAATATAIDRDEHSNSTISSQEDLNSQLQELLSQTTKNDEENEDEEMSEAEASFTQASITTNNDLLNNSSQLHIWDDFNLSGGGGLDKSSNEPWNMNDDEEPFSNYDSDIPSSSWNFNDISLFSQTPSLLFSDATMCSALEEELKKATMATTATPPMIVTTPLPMTSTPGPLSETNNNCEDVTLNISTSNANTPGQAADGLWFQFANFDDDYQCETNTPTGVA